eukprot:m.184520 g.184520  ORF g.184520 m.184520 type:complete len:111 (-) comp16669_c5_seq7:653-985(-)
MGDDGRLLFVVSFPFLLSIAPLSRSFSLTGERLAISLSFFHLGGCACPCFLSPGTKGGAATIGDAARSNIPQPHARHLLADHKRLYASLHWSCTFVGNGCGTAQACFHNY